ncbi:MAG: DUF1365 family protein [Mycobacterium sp.]
MTAPAIYRTRVTHLRRAPVHHYFEHKSYSWYVDLDDLPKLPAIMRPFARFEARDHFEAPQSGEDTIRTRVDSFLASHGVHLRGGRITALMQARVLGYVFNPLSLFWCHDADGTLRAVVAEVHNTYGGRHAYLLPPDDTQAVMVAKKLYVSPFNEVDGYYLVRAPRPAAELDVTISLHRENQPAFVATLRGKRMKAGVSSVARMQVVAPVAPLMGALAIRVQGVTLWMRRVPVVPREGICPHAPAAPVAPVAHEKVNQS